MERLNTCSLREKEVINLCDGTRIGCPDDFEVSVGDGRIVALIVPRPSGFLGLSHANDLVIPWHKIECIGEDAILVRLSNEELCRAEQCKKRKRIL
jgi:YlmC/YmxH family sporulation protein